MIENHGITILLAISVLCALCIIFLLFSRMSLQKKLIFLEEQYNTHQVTISDQQMMFTKQVSEWEKLFQVYNEKQQENEQVSKQLEHRIKTLQTDFTDYKNFIESTQSQQPEDKLYSRALKLVKLGADIEEIIRECDIPRVEAEMLLAVHHKK